jgi:hypothetical protein
MGAAQERKRGTAITLLTISHVDSGIARRRHTPTGPDAGSGLTRLRASFQKWPISYGWRLLGGCRLASHSSPFPSPVRRTSNGGEFGMVGGWTLKQADVMQARVSLVSGGTGAETETRR